MYNFFSQHRTVFKYAFWVAVFIITGLLFYFASDIFKIENVYFYTSSSIVQGFITLVALLGAVVVFKVQLEDQAMQKLSDGVEVFVGYYHGNAAKMYTPTQMMNACEKILEMKLITVIKNLLKKLRKKWKKRLRVAMRLETKWWILLLSPFLMLLLRC